MGQPTWGGKWPPGLTLKAVALWEDRVRIKTLANAAVLKVKTFWLKAEQSATLLYAAALHLLHGRLMTSVKTLRLFSSPSD